MTIQIDAENIWTDLQKHIPAEVVDGLNIGWAEIMERNLAEPCLKMGDKAPDFALPSATGKIVTLADQLARGPVVLTFYRGVWCPFCILALQTYQRNLDKIRAKGASLVAISPQTPDHSISMKEKNALEYGAKRRRQQGGGEIRHGVYGTRVASTDSYPVWYAPFEGQWR